MKIHNHTANGRSYEFWYDRTAGQVWYAMEVDENGNFGESIDDHNKASIIELINAGCVPTIEDLEVMS